MEFHITKILKEIIAHLDITKCQQPSSYVRHVLSLACQIHPVRQAEALPAVVDGGIRPTLPDQ